MNESECECEVGRYLSFGGECAQCYVKRAGDLGIDCPAIGGPPQLLPGFHSTALPQDTSGDGQVIAYAPLAEIKVFACSLYQADAEHQICPGGAFGTCYAAVPRWTSS